jgi:hypothetical protein
MLGGRGKLSLLAIVVLAGLGSAVALQWSSTDPGLLSVRVRDVTDRPLAGALVVLSRAGGAEVARVTANYKGEVQFSSILAAEYEVRCELAGLEPDYTALVKVRPHLPSRVTLTMTVWDSPGDSFAGEPTKTPTGVAR